MMGDDDKDQLPDETQAQPAAPVQQPRPQAQADTTVVPGYRNDLMHQATADLAQRRARAAAAIGDWQGAQQWANIFQLAQGALNQFRGLVRHPVTTREAAFNDQMAAQGQQQMGKAVESLAASPKEQLEAEQKAEGANIGNVATQLRATNEAEQAGALMESHAAVSPAQQATEESGQRTSATALAGAHLAESQQRLERGKWEMTPMGDSPYVHLVARELNRDPAELAQLSPLEMDKELQASNAKETRNLRQMLFNMSQQNKREEEFRKASAVRIGLGNFAEALDQATQIASKTPGNVPGLGPAKQGEALPGAAGKAVQYFKTNETDLQMVSQIDQMAQALQNIQQARGIPPTAAPQRKEAMGVNLPGATSPTFWKGLHSQATEAIEHLNQTTGGMTPEERQMFGIDALRAKLERSLREIEKYDRASAAGPSSGGGRTGKTLRIKVVPDDEYQKEQQ